MNTIIRRPPVRLRILPSLIPVDGLQIEVQASATYIQWRYVGSDDWINLVPLADLVGPIGPATEMQSDGEYIQYRPEGESTWINLVALTDLEGPQGEPGPEGPPVIDGNKGDVEVSSMGTTWTVNIADPNARGLATAAQGALAGSAVQPGDIGVGGGFAVNFHMFGVDDTGVTSAVSAIEAAFDLAASLGAEVRPLPGVYLIDSPIVMPEGLIWRSTRSAVYRNSSASPANPMFINGEIGGSFAGATANSNITVYGGSFDANNTLTTCLAFGQADDIQVEDASFSNVYDAHFIEFCGINRGAVRNCNFDAMFDTVGGTDRSYSEAINIDFAANVAQFPYWDAASFDGRVCKSIEVSGNSFNDCLVSVGAHGYTAFGDGTVNTMSNQISIFGNRHRDNGANTSAPQSDAIHCDGFLGLTIHAETIENAKNNGIRIDECLNFSVTGCAITAAGGNAIFVEGDAIDCGDGAISANVARGVLDLVRMTKANRISISGNSGASLRNGVQIDTCDDCGVVGNSFEACSGRGVYLNGGNNRTTVNGNRIRNTTEHNLEVVGGAFNNVTGNNLSLPGGVSGGKANIRVDGGGTGVIGHNVGNGASVSENIKVTGSAQDYSIMGNHFQGSGTTAAAMVIDAGCDDILYDANRFFGPGTTITDNGTNSVVGTNWTT